MHDMHELINKYIEGRLNTDEEDQLWMNVLHKPLWYDYFMTEITAQKILKPSDRTIQINDKVLKQLPEKLKENFAVK